MREHITGTGKWMQPACICSSVPTHKLHAVTVCLWLVCAGVGLTYITLPWFYGHVLPCCSTLPLAKALVYSSHMLSFCPWVMTYKGPEPTPFRWSCLCIAAIRVSELLVELYALPRLPSHLLHLVSHSGCSWGQGACLMRLLPPYTVRGGWDLCYILLFPHDFSIGPL